MTIPDDQDLVLVPAGKARAILDLLGTTEAMLSALAARALRGTPATAPGINQLAALLTGGQDVPALGTRLDSAHRG